MQIKAVEADWWEFDHDHLKFMQDERLHPPARSFTVQSNASVAVVISFEVQISGSPTWTVNVVKEFNPSKN